MRIPSILRLPLASAAIPLILASSLPAGAASGDCGAGGIDYGRLALEVVLLDRKESMIANVVERTATESWLEDYLAEVDALLERIAVSKKEMSRVRSEEIYMPPLDRDKLGIGVEGAPEIGVTSDGTVVFHPGSKIRLWKQHMPKQEGFTVNYVYPLPVATLKAVEELEKKLNEIRSTEKAILAEELVREVWIDEEIAAENAEKTVSDILGPEWLQGAHGAGWWKDGLVAGWPVDDEFSKLLAKLAVNPSLDEHGRALKALEAEAGELRSKIKSHLAPAVRQELHRLSMVEAMHRKPRGGKAGGAA